MLYKLELTREQLAVISDALGNAPFRLAAPVIAEMNKQLQEQQPKPNGNAEERTNVVPN